MTSAIVETIDEMAVADLLCLLIGDGAEAKHPAFKENDIEGPLDLGPGVTICSVTATLVSCLIVSGDQYLCFGCRLLALAGELVECLLA